MRAKVMDWNRVLNAVEAKAAAAQAPKSPTSCPGGEKSAASLSDLPCRVGGALRTAIET